MDGENDVCYAIALFVGLKNKVRYKKSKANQLLRFLVLQLLIINSRIVDSVAALAYALAPGVEEFIKVIVPMRTPNCGPKGIQYSRRRFTVNERY